jgi:hypothetical protein
MSEDPGLIGAVAIGILLGCLIGSFKIVQYNKCNNGQLGACAMLMK